ncbi:hypothetical protein GGR58DRAFT_514711 [Xylaria digitata]|nr:hypothetical protein GGR58DRAFT_514711 [Xylaria digitata]
MYFSTLTSLAFACKTAFTVPTSDRAANLPLPVRTIFQFDETVPNSWFENIALRRNGDLLPLSGSPKVSIINVDDANGILGIVETTPDVFAVVAGKFSGLAVPVAGTMAVWEVDFRRSEPTTRLVTKMPEAGLLNGVTTASSCSLPVILVADNGISRVWRVDLQTGRYETAAEVPEMKSVPNATLPLGINGVRAHGEHLYFNNSNLASIFRLSVDERGVVAKNTAAELVAKLDADFIDDFIVDEDGKFWVTTNSGNTVVVAETGSDGVVVAGAPTELTVAGNTALALGRGSNIDKNIVYAVTGGIINRPVNGTVAESAKVVAIDRTGFK